MRKRLAISVALGVLTTIAVAWAWALALCPAKSVSSQTGMGISNPVEPTLHRLVYVEEESRVGLSWTQLSVSCKSPNSVRAKWDSLTGMDPTPANWNLIVIDEPVVRDRF